MAKKLSSKEVELLLAKMQKPKQAISAVENTGKAKPRAEENPVSKEAMAMFMGQLQRKSDSQKRYINDAGPAPVYKNVGEKVRADLERESRQRDLRASIPNEKFNSWVENVAVPAAEIGMYADLATPIVKKLSKKGVELLSELPLNNVSILNKAYKINPWAFKTNKANWYRQVGESAINDALETGLIRETGEEVSPRMLEEFNKQIKRLQGDDEILDHSERQLQQILASRRPNAPFFSKGELFYPMERKPIVTKSGKISKNPAGKGSANYLIETELPNESFQPAYVKGMQLGTPEEVGSTAILKPNPTLRDIENFKLYEKNWLQGYKPKKISEETLNILKKKKNGKG